MYTAPPLPNSSCYRAPSPRENRRNRHRAGRDEQPGADGRGHGQVVVHLHFGNPFCNKNFEALFDVSVEHSPYD